MVKNLNIGFCCLFSIVNMDGNYRLKMAHMSQAVHTRTGGILKKKKIKDENSNLVSQSIMSKSFFDNCMQYFKHIQR